MKKRILVTLGTVTILALAGCQNTASNAETEQLRQQVAELQQQVTALEKQDASAKAASQETTNGASAQETPEETGAEQPAAASETGAEQPAAASETDTEQPAAASETGTEQPAAASETGAEQPAAGTAAEQASTTNTIEELTKLVDDYVAKVDTAQPSGSIQDKMSQFMELKQEEGTIERTLDQYENELERLYRNGTLTREEYIEKEREAEMLEEQLDYTEDTLEYLFGVDD